MINYKEALIDITTIMFDFDGVLSDGKVLVMPDGEQLRMSNVRDGYALQLAVKKGFRIVIISGGRSESMSKRFIALNVTDVFLGVSNKKAVFEKYITDNHLTANEVLYMGDDIPDYEVMNLARIAACPANASEEIKAISHYISKFNGGEGCARDIIEQVLKIHGKWFDKDAFEW
jgi:3-deoxy-D-manno-octulosonate 8-phosphate phosphatase (KDO 8-P phosphatase)